jgi:GrpB-like predicted nucleotidyltransferase (UPF0157 family)
MSMPMDLTIGPYESRPVACHDYDFRAAAVARQAADVIAMQFPRVRAEHVGSTAVPGCVGQGIVDLMIAAADEESAAILAGLDALGFQQSNNIEPLATDAFLRVGSMVYDGTTYLLHVHVLPANAAEVEGMRFFRICLRSDPELLKAYTARKREIIASGTTDPATYFLEKSKFIKEVLG